MLKDIFSKTRQGISKTIANFQEICFYEIPLILKIHTETNFAFSFEGQGSIEPYD